MQLISKNDTQLTILSNKNILEIVNVFTDNYPQPIFENGIQLKDMVYLECFLKNDRRLKK